jgi:hypothetical protein
MRLDRPFVAEWVIWVHGGLPQGHLGDFGRPCGALFSAPSCGTYAAPRDMERDGSGNIVNVSRHGTDFKMATTTSAPSPQGGI